MAENENTPNTSTPTQQPAAPAAPPAAPDHDSMSARLERERFAVLRQLGIKPEPGKTAAEAIAEAAAKGEGRKQRVRDAEAKAAKAEADAKAAADKLGALKVFADGELSRLDPNLSTKIKELAGDDPAEQLRQIELMRALTGQGTNTPAPKAAPANTGAPPAPVPGGAGAGLPVHDRYDALGSIQDPTARAAAKIFFASNNTLELLQPRKR